MVYDEFEAWLGRYLRVDSAGARKILGNPSPMRFLLMWSMFEPAVFGRMATEKSLAACAEKLAASGLALLDLSKPLEHFHVRYRKKSAVDRLFYKEAPNEKRDDKPSSSRKRLEDIIRAPLDNISPADGLFFLLLIVFRFRNNIFHGNKRNDTWAEYAPQMQLCTSVMQVILDHKLKASEPSIVNQDMVLNDGLVTPGP